jgi:hypothetical protein
MDLVMSQLYSCGESKHAKTAFSQIQPTFPLISALHKPTQNLKLAFQVHISFKWHPGVSFTL